MRLSLAMRDGSALVGDKRDVRRLLEPAAGFGSEKESVGMTLVSETSAGRSEREVTLRWINEADVIFIEELPDA